LDEPTGGAAQKRKAHYDLDIIYRHDAAAWTYVAAFITSLAYFPGHGLPLLTGGRQRE